MSLTGHVNIIEMVVLPKFLYLFSKCTNNSYCLLLLNNIFYCYSLYLVLETSLYI